MFCFVVLATIQMQISTLGQVLITSKYDCWPGLSYAGMPYFKAHKINVILQTCKALQQVRRANLPPNCIFQLILVTYLLLPHRFYKVKRLFLLNFSQKSYLNYHSNLHILLPSSSLNYHKYYLGNFKYCH